MAHATANTTALAMAPEATGKLRFALFGGGGIGLLFGVIMGTTSTPVIATMLGALTAVLAGILGLNDNLFNNAKAMRIGGFGICCVLGAYLGLYVRSHNVLAPSLLELKQTYLAVGFSEQQALNFLAMKEFGVSLASLQQNEGKKSEGKPVLAQSDAQPASKSATQSVEVMPSQQNAAQTLFKQHNSLLFSASVAVSGCEELVYTDDSLALDEVLNNFELTGGVWEKLAEQALEHVPEPEQKAWLLTIKQGVCRVLEAGSNHQASNNQGSNNPLTGSEAKSVFPVMAAGELRLACADMQHRLLQTGRHSSDVTSTTRFNGTNGSTSDSASFWVTQAKQMQAAGLSARSAYQALGQIHGLLCKEKH